jgi:hypothetical protein
LKPGLERFISMDWNGNAAVVSALA